MVGSTQGPQVAHSYSVHSYSGGGDEEGAEEAEEAKGEEAAALSPKMRLQARAASCPMPHSYPRATFLSRPSAEGDRAVPHASCLMPHASYLIPHTLCSVPPP